MCRGKGSRTSRREKCNSCHHIRPLFRADLRFDSAIRAREYSDACACTVYAREIITIEYLYYAFHASMNTAKRALSKRYGCLEYNAFVCNAVKRTQAETDQNSWRIARYKYTVLNKSNYRNLLILFTSPNLTLLEISCVFHPILSSDSSKFTSSRNAIIRQNSSPVLPLCDSKDVISLITLRLPKRVILTHFKFYEQ